VERLSSVHRYLLDWLLLSRALQRARTNFPFKFEIVIRRPYVRRSYNVAMKGFRYGHWHS
jgi:hypothetical protein